MLTSYQHLRAIISRIPAMSVARKSLFIQLPSIVCLWIETLNRLHWCYIEGQVVNVWGRSQLTSDAGQREKEAGEVLRDTGQMGKAKRCPWGPLGENTHLMTQRIREQKERWKCSVCLYLRKCLHTNFTSFTMFLRKLLQPVLTSCPLIFAP